MRREETPVSFFVVKEVDVAMNTEKMKRELVTKTETITSERFSCMALSALNATPKSIIERNTVILVSRKECFYTVEDNQTSVATEESLGELRSYILELMIGFEKVLVGQDKKEITGIFDEIERMR